MQSINAGFPVCSVAIVTDSDGDETYMVVGGGGGPSKSGIPNGIAVYSMAGQRVAMLDTSGDPVMCVAVQREALVGGKAVLVAGVGIRGWRVVFDAGERTLLLTASARTDHGGDEDPHQRMLAAGAHVVATVACDAAVRLWTVTELDGWEQGECLLFNGPSDCVNDIAMLPDDPQDAFYCVANGADIFKFHRSQSEKWIKSGISVQKRPGFTVRCVRTSTLNHCIFVCSINRQKRCSFVDCYSADHHSLVFTASVDRVITAAHTSGDLLAVGCSDGTVCIYLIQYAHGKLRLVRKYEHSFAVTSVCVKDATVVSGSADGTVKTVNVARRAGRQADTVLLLLLSALLVLVAHLLHSYKSQFTLI